MNFFRERLLQIKLSIVLTSACFTLTSALSALKRFRDQVTEGSESYVVNIPFLGKEMLFDLAVFTLGFVFFFVMSDVFRF